MAFPPAQGERVPWDRLPSEIRVVIEQRLGATVTRAATSPGGFSPGLAARLELEDGRRVFAKAVGPEPNRDSPGGPLSGRAKVGQSAPMEAELARRVLRRNR